MEAHARHRGKAIKYESSIDQRHCNTLLWDAHVVAHNNVMPSNIDIATSRDDAFENLSPRIFFISSLIHAACDIIGRCSCASILFPH